MLKKSIFCLLMISLLSFAFKPVDQNCSVYGKITDSSNGDPIPFAHIGLLKKDSVVANATSDVNGDYCFKNISPGKYNITVVYVGYKKFQSNGVTITTAGKVMVNAKLNSNGNVKLDELSVVTYQVPIMDADTKVGKTITREEYKYMANKNISSVRGGRAAGGIYQQEFNTEEYSKINDNEFKEAKKNPLSTLSIDVDKASYSNVRRFIMQGNLPPADAVRVEEMINYFSYNYPQPKGDDPFSITTEYTECPWNSSHNLIHIGLQGKEIKTDNLPANNLVFLLDVSGSMESADKLPLVKSGIRLLVEQMRTQDNISIVVYAGAAGVVLPPTSGAHKEKILDALEQLQAGGSTAGGEGILLAYKTAKENFNKEGNNRIILCTDGDFNVGVSSDGDLIRLIEKKREEGVFLTVLGFGTGNYKDSKMEQLADKGNGNYAYIDNILEAKKVLVKEMGGTLLTIAKDVKIQIEFNPGKVKAYRLVGYENRLLASEDFNDDKKDAGELGSGHTVTAIYEIIPAGSSEPVASVDELKYQQTITNSNTTSDVMTIKFRYKEPKESKSKLITEVVLDNKIAFSKASENCKFSSCVAEFGMVLRDSKFKGESNYKNILALAKSSKGKDEEGYRSEFIRLVEMAELLKK